jgi:hypothetical protein
LDVGFDFGNVLKSNADYGTRCSYGALWSTIRHRARPHPHREQQSSTRNDRAIKSLLTILPAKLPSPQLRVL